MLRHMTSTIAICALAGTVSVFAQEQQQQTPAPGQEKQQVQKQTLTGCVVEAKTTDGRKVYVLNNVAGGSAAMYLLTGSSESEWATNVSKKVEVTGPVQQPSPPAKDGAEANPNAVRPPSVEVESMKMVAESCK